MHDRVDVWLINTDCSTDDSRALEPWLDDDERRRADDLRLAPHRQRFVVAHAALRLITAAAVGVDPVDVRFARGPNGKPWLAGAGPEVNLSHTDGLAAVAVAAPTRPVGVDVERAPAESVAIRLSRRYFTPAEAEYVVAGSPADCGPRFARLWTRKEACVKAAGGRLFHGLHVPVGGERAEGLVVDHGGPYLVLDVPTERDVFASVALRGPERAKVVTRWWAPSTVVGDAW
jgi:4'-phosphopantetheinyl transferase